MSEPLEKLSSSFLLTRFEEFYSDLVRVKRAVVADPWGIGARTDGESDREDLRRMAAHSVRQRLEMLLQKQAAEAAARQGDHGAARYREAQYVMAALADEIFLHLEWEGRAAWASNLLETKLFGTHLAGERVFKRIEQLLAERDSSLREIQVIYLLSLSLGFEGRYRGDRSGELERLRSALYDLVFPREPSIVRGERHLFPQTYMHTLDRSKPIGLPAIGRWAAALAVVLTIYLGVAHYAWVDVTTELRQANAAIAEISQ